MKHSRRLAGGTLLVTLAAVIAGCGQAAGHGAARAAAASAASGRPSTAAATPPTPTPWPLVLPVPAALPGQHQTGRRPPAHNRVFSAEMTDLWAAVVSGRPGLAMPAFFPLVAYKQVKAVYNPAADWRNRLVTEFDADILAAHQLLGRHARHAALIRVVVPEAEAGWIPPGACANGVGYWHVAGARVVYRVNGEERSFGIAALISWRGRWYVVHLGGELRTVAGGMIDDPASGPGAAGPPGGC